MKLKKSVKFIANVKKCLFGLYIDEHSYFYVARIFGL